MKIIAKNKKASFNYFLLDTFEAGIVLQGTEIKSVRANKVNIVDAHCIIRKDEMFIVNMHIAKYDHGNLFNHDETRQRKLLLHKKQIVKLHSKMMQESLTVVPIKVYMEKGLCKVEIALAKGKKNYDKRHSLKEKDDKRNMARKMKERF